MKPETAEAVRNILQDRKNGLGTLSQLCKKYGISTPTFYKARREVSPSKKRKYTKKSALPAFVDVPLHTDHKVYIVTTNIANLRRVMESL